MKWLIQNADHKYLAEVARLAHVGMPEQLTDDPAKAKWWHLKVDALKARATYRYCSDSPFSVVRYEPTPEPEPVRDVSKTLYGCRHFDPTTSIQEAAWFATPEEAEAAMQGYAEVFRRCFKVAALQVKLIVVDNG